MSRGYRWGKTRAACNVAIEPGGQGLEVRHAAHDELTATSGKDRTQRERVTRVLAAIKADDDLVKHWKTYPSLLVLMSKRSRAKRQPEVRNSTLSSGPS